jgi:hypothetical protein
MMPHFNTNSVVHRYNDGAPVLSAKDIPYQAAQLMVKKYICESSYPPSIADIRREASEMTSPGDEMQDAGSAWGEVVRSIRIYGIYRPEEAISSMSRRTADVVKNMSWQDICMCENLSVIRGQFLKIYACLEERETKERMLPVELRRELGEAASRMLLLEN